MDTIDKLVTHLADSAMPLTREQIETRIAQTGEDPDEWLKHVQQFNEDLKDPDYLKSDPTGVVDMDKFSDPLAYDLIGS